MSAVYNLFLRNWINNRASEEHIALAVEKQLITQDEAETIKASERDNQTP